MININGDIMISKIIKSRIFVAPIAIAVVNKVVNVAKMVFILPLQKFQNAWQSRGIQLEDNNINIFDSGVINTDSIID